MDFGSVMQIVLKFRAAVEARPRLFCGCPPSDVSDNLRSQLLVATELPGTQSQDTSADVSEGNLQMACIISLES